MAARIFRGLKSSNGQMRDQKESNLVATALLAEKLDAVRNEIESLEILIAKYPFKNIDQRLRLRELQILYRAVAKSLQGAVEMF